MDGRGWPVWSFRCTGGDSPAGGADGGGEPDVGVHAYPWRPEECGASRRAVDHGSEPESAGIAPVPDRPTSWQTFLRAHWGAIAGASPGALSSHGFHMRSSPTAGGMIHGVSRSAKTKDFCNSILIDGA